MKKIKAFTLLETLIVIMVFCVGILVVVHGLSQTLRNKEYANTQIKSAFFAREWIEMVFNLRDANYHKKLPWNCIFTSIDHLKEEYEVDENPFCDNYLWSWDLQVLKISMWSGDQYIHVETSGDIQDFTWMFEAYQIYVHTWLLNNNTWFYYDYDSENGERTWFARYLVITWVVYNENDNHPIDKQKLLKIESHVLYKRWTLTWEKVMETFIWNYEFKQ